MRGSPSIASCRKRSHATADSAYSLRSRRPGPHTRFASARRSGSSLRHLKAVQLTLGLAFLLVALLGGTAHAQEGGTSVGGTMFRVDDEGARQLVPGVKFTVKQGGKVVGTDETGDDGLWRVDVPGSGTYEVDLDTSTLPDGVGLRDPDRAKLETVEVLEGQQKSVLFPLG